jgi:hypothetical protein
VAYDDGWFELHGLPSIDLDEGRQITNIIRPVVIGADERFRDEDLPADSRVLWQGRGLLAIRPDCSDKELLSSLVRRLRDRVEWRDYVINKIKERNEANERRTVVRHYEHAVAHRAKLMGAK